MSGGEHTKPGREKAGAAEQGKTLGWYVGVPICTNPMFLLDMLLLVCALWVGGMLFIMLGQATIGGGLTRGSVFAAFFLGMYLAGIALAAFVFVGGFLFNNRYASLFRIDKRGIYCEHMRGEIRALAKPRIPLGGYAVEPLRNPARTIEKRIAWNEIRSVQVLEKMRVLLLKGKRGTLLRIYCPDAALLQKAQALIENYRAIST